MSITVRAAVAADAPGLVAAHVRSWQAAYQQFFTPDYLAGLSSQTKSRVARWTRIIEDPDEEGSVTFVAVDEDTGRVTGFLSAGPARDDDAEATTGEVYGCYVDPAHWRRGVGALMMERSFEHFESLGFTTATLWVFEENHGSRRFYERLGWAASSTCHLFERDGYAIPEIRYERAF